MQMLEKEDAKALKKVGVNFLFLAGVMIALIIISIYYS